MSDDPIIAFYLDSNLIKEQIGFTFSDVMQLDREQLESCHSYIQWLFPLREPSAFNPDAPLVTQTTIDQYAEKYSIIAPKIDRAFWLMHQFYFDDKQYSWITPNDHNYLRITRIIKSLRIFQLYFNAAFF